MWVGLAWRADRSRRSPEVATSRIGHERHLFGRRGGTIAGDRASVDRHHRLISENHPGMRERIGARSASLTASESEPT